MGQRYTRRGFVAGTAVVFSGCLGGGDEGENDGGNGEDRTGDDTGDGAEDGPDGEGTTDDTDGTETDDETDEQELDLREANVTSVTFSREGDETHNFDVTLYHDDDGEDGYANWWQVESLDGARLGRRDLTHPHGTQRFTRSETVETGEETCVVVRGHDQTHGYGGRAVVVNLETGETNGVLQGEEPSSFDEGDCP